MNFSIDFNKFSQLDRGDSFKINYKWRVDSKAESIYMISYNNSYRLNNSNPAFNPQRNINDFRYLSFYCLLGEDFSNVFIKPNTWVEKLTNIFLFFVKKKQIRKSNKWVTLESLSNIEYVERILNQNILKLFENTDSIKLQINNGHCLVWDEKPCNYENSRRMIMIIKELQEIIRV